MYFPTICVDNFFNDPDSIRNFALSLDYQKSPNGHWPGLRSKPLDQICPEYFQKFCEKLFLLNYDIRRHDDISWRVETEFQIMPPEYYGPINTGWIHRDHQTMFAGVVYLTPDINLNCGTSIYRSQNFSESVNAKEKHEMYLDFNTDKIEFYKEKLQENNALFEETARFNNVYNRLIAYDGFHFHGVNQFYDNDKNNPRLTQVFFVKTISADYFPIPASKQISL